MGLQDWTTDSDKFEPEEGGLTRLAFPCCACKHQGKTDADEPCRSCGHNVNAGIDTADICAAKGNTNNAEAHGRAVARTLAPIGRRRNGAAGG